MTGLTKFVSGDGSVWTLDGTDTVTALEGAEGLFEIPIELGLEQRIDADGAVVFTRRLAARRVLLPLLLRQPGGVVLTVWRSLMRALYALNGTLTYTDPSATERTLEGVTLESPDRSMSGWDLGAQEDDVITVSLLAADPWWYGPTTSTFLNLGAVTLSDDAAVSSNDPATPADGGGSTQIANGGDEVALPRFVITGPFDSLTLLGVDTGERIQLAAPLLAGNQIVIDSTPLNRGPTLNGGKVTWQLITDQSRLFLLPRPSATVSINAVGTTGASSVEIQWRTRYLTP